jgi:hypothetical protein
MEELLVAATAGDSRAFELLPARFVRDQARARAAALGLEDPVPRRLAAAASEMAWALSPSARLRALTDLLARPLPPHHALFFGADSMSPELIVQATPEPLKKHGVFGAFSAEDFARHM